MGIDKTYKADEIKLFTGIETVFGSTGDVTPWHGHPVDHKYTISKDTWFQYWADETVVMATLYADWLSDPNRDFYLITRGLEKMSDTLRTNIDKAIPNSRYAISDHLVCKTYMENGEKTSFTAKDTTNRLTHTQRGGNYVLSNCAQDVALPDDSVHVDMGTGSHYHHVCEDCAGARHLWVLQ